jgi:hypothetical protein
VLPPATAVERSKVPVSKSTMPSAKNSMLWWVVNRQPIVAVGIELNEFGSRSSHGDEANGL